MLKSIHPFISVLLIAGIALAPHGLYAASKHHPKEKPSETVVAYNNGKRSGPPVVDLDISNLFSKPEKKPVRRRISRAPDVAKVELGGNSAAKLFEEINRARLALAQNNSASALQHLRESQEVISTLDTDGDGTARQDIETGYFFYYHGKHIAYHYYFPMNTELAEWTGPEDTVYWTENGGVTIKEANAVTATLTIAMADTSRQLSDAFQATEQSKNDEAQSILTRIVENMVTHKTSKKMPLIKARDNIMLTRYFMDANNFDAARVALRHARDGLNEAERDKRYKNSKEEIHAMEKEVVAISKDVASKDPTFLGQTATNFENWWYSLTDLSDNPPDVSEKTPEKTSEKQPSETSILNSIRQDNQSGSGTE